MKNLIAFLSFLLACSSAFSQAFSGSIDFMYATQKDTTNNAYIVKGKRVKLDQYSKKGNTIEGSFLFDLGANEIKFLNPKRKLWGKQKSETPQVIKGQCVVAKGTATQKIAGIKCIEYTVKNTEENTVVTFWITEQSNFEFFIPLIKLWNRKDKQSIYFGQIKGLASGQMPMMSEERQISDGKIQTKLEVKKISKTPPSDSAFDIPAGYTKFEQ